MLAIEELVQRAVVAGGGSALPTQTKEDLQWDLHVGCVIQISQRGGKKQRSFALYCGRGRVIHAWSSSRRNFRVRVDALRMLERAGYAVTECSETMDSFCREMFGFAPMDPAQVVQRATSALHAKTSLRLSSLSLILFARYGDAVFELRKSLKKAFATTVNNVADHGTSAVAAICDDDGNTPPPLSPLDLPSPKTSYGSPKYGHTPALLPTEPGIKNFLGSLGEHVLTMWLMKSLGSFLREPQPANDWHGLLVPPLSTDTVELQLKYDKEEAQFTMRFCPQLQLALRLAEDSMECGICLTDFNMVAVMMMKCSHYICEACLRSLLNKVCPYCRAPIRSVHEIAECVKREATKLMLPTISPEDALPTAESPETAQENELEPPSEPELPSPDAAPAENALEIAAPATILTVESPENAQETDAELPSPEPIPAATALELASPEAAAAMTAVETVPDQAPVHPSVGCNDEAEGDESD